MKQSGFFGLPGWLRTTIRDPFRRYLVLALILLGAFVGLHEARHRHPIPDHEAEVAFFFHPQCPHCQRQKAFIPYLEAKYPELRWTAYDTSQPGIAKVLVDYLAKHRRSPTDIGVPMTFIGPYLIIGFDSPETTGILLEEAIRAYLKDDPSLFSPRAGIGRRGGKVTLPLLGAIDPGTYSLPALTVILGLVDGFNPCAMWVLVYLISVIVSLGDRRKIWYLVGIFVCSSGLLYYLFMTAWLNLFLLLGYLRWLTLSIGLAALGAGILTVREYLQSGGRIQCAIGNGQSRAKTTGRIDRLVDAPLSLISIGGIFALALVVNSIEFACSAALPAIYTHTLSLRGLPELQYYAYIFAYVFFFMLDDLVIFSLAVLALDTGIGQRYAGHCRLLGGVVLIGLGSLMVLRPDLLR